MEPRCLDRHARERLRQGGVLPGPAATHVDAEVTVINQAIEDGASIVGPAWTFRCTRPVSHGVSARRCMILNGTKVESGAEI